MAKGKLLEIALVMGVIAAPKRPLSVGSNLSVIEPPHPLYLIRCVNGRQGTEVTAAHSPRKLLTAWQAISLCQQLIARWLVMPSRAASAFPRDLLRGQQLGLLSAKQLTDGQAITINLLLDRLYAGRGRGGWRQLKKKVMSLASTIHPPLNAKQGSRDALQSNSGMKNFIMQEIYYAVINYIYWY